MHEFELQDADGQSHRYHVVPHGAVDGEAIVYRLAELLAEPLAALVDGAGEKLDLSNVDLDTILEQLDIRELGKAVRSALAGSRMAELRAAVLRHTSRDGKKLSDATSFNEAYQRNYGELFRAVFEVTRFNRFFPGLSTP